MADVIFPWPSRAERRARIELAREKAGQAKEKAEEAAAISGDLQRILKENHFAQTIVEGLMRRDDKK
jgi:hypothetical protein